MSRTSIIIAFSLFVAMFWLVESLVTRESGFLFNLIDQTFSLSSRLPEVPLIDLAWVMELWVMLGTVWLLSVFFWIAITLCVLPKSRAIQRLFLFAVLVIPVGISSAPLAQDRGQTGASQSVNNTVLDLYDRAKLILSGQ